LTSGCCSQGLAPTRADPCIYTKRQGSTFLMLSVHVDDQIIACTSRSALDSFKHSNNKFECSDSGPADYFLYRDRLASLTCLTNIISTYLIDLTDRLQPVTIAYRTTTAKARFRQLSPRVAHHRTPKNGNARSFGLLAFQTPRLPRFTFCATAEIET